MQRGRHGSTTNLSNATHLATGILVGGGRLLMVASRYPNHPQPLWNLPGGRQLPGELLEETAVREFFEETGLRVDAGEVAYVSESYDGEKHFLNVTFRVTLRQAHDDRVEALTADDHVAGVEWVPLSEVAERIVVAVVREPLIEYLGGSLVKRYAGFHQSDVTIEWPQDSR